LENKIESVMKKSLLRLMLIISFFIGCKNDNKNEKSRTTDITVVSYGGGSYHQSHVDVFIEPYKKLTGIEVNPLVWNAEYGKLKAMVESGKVPWDVVEVTDAEFKRGQKENLYEKMSQRPDTANFLKGSISDFGVANVYWTTVLAFNKNSFPNKKPATWNDFWNIKEFPGKRALYDDPRGNLEFALIADGVSKDNLYPLDIERAFKKLDQIKPYVKVWWKDGTQPVQLLNDGSVDITSAWNGRIYSLGSANTKIQYSWEGAASELDWWVIPKGSKNVETASRFICFASEPDKMARQAEIIGYGPVNKKALRYIPDSIKIQLPTSEENWRISFVVNSQWWSENEANMMKRRLEWKSK
jgi:putative spermidine/putrescine transport system substrate-binding protein